MPSNLKSQNHKMKHLNCSIVYDDRDELKDVFKKIQKLASLGVENYKEERNASSFEFEQKMVLDESIEVRFEMIEGKHCIIIPSKINEL